jgi:hypothetical protein
VVIGYKPISAELVCGKDITEKKHTTNKRETHMSAIADRTAFFFI